MFTYSQFNIHLAWFKVSLSRFILINLLNDVLIFNFSKLICDVCGLFTTYFIPMFFMAQWGKYLVFITGIRPTTPKN